MTNDNDFQIYCHSSENMPEIEPNSVGMVVSSPPYNVGIGYDAYNDKIPWKDYFTMIKSVMAACAKVVCYGGKVCINVANVYRKPYIPLTMYYHQILRSVGLSSCAEIIWLKNASANHSCAWGSWELQTSPSLRDSHEYILIYCKKNPNAKKEKDKYNRIMPKNFKKEAWEYGEYERLTRSEYYITSESDKKHPAVFPIELPLRLIKLYSFPGDIILDPFLGSGTTLMAAKSLKRKGIGYDLSKRYCDIAKMNIASTDTKKQKSVDDFF